MGAAELQEGKTEPGTFVAQGKKRDGCTNTLAITFFYNKEKSVCLAFLWKNKYIDLKSPK